MKRGTNGVAKDGAMLCSPSKSNTQSDSRTSERFRRCQQVAAEFLILLALATPLVARAGEEKDGSEGLAGRFGNYVSASGSLTWVAGDLTIPGAFVNGAPVFPQTSLSLNSGYNAAVAVGMYQGNMRGEVEFSYRNNDISHVVNMPNITSSSGGVSAFSIMFNGFGDVALTRRLSLYGGGGLGIAFMDLNVRATQAVGPSYEVDGTSPAFALQGMVGLNYQIARRITLTGGYRLWSAFGVDAAFVSTGGASAAHISSNNHFDMPLIHGPEVGLRFDF